MSDNRFVYNPSTVDIQRSKFLMNSYWKGAIYHGDLVPLEILPVMPGDSAKYDLSLFIRTATPPIAPFMDSIKLSVAAFYVPTRLVWNKEKEFMGENTEGYGIQSEVLAPRSLYSSMSVPANVAATSYARSIGTYLGIVRQKTTSLTSPSPLALNPIRAFLQVYNDWFRNENFMDPYLWNHSETGDASRYVGTLSGIYVSMLSDVPKVCKNLDRYTSCLPWAQKGSPVLLPLGEFAPVVGREVEYDGQGNMTYTGALSVDRITGSLIKSDDSLNNTAAIGFVNTDDPNFGGYMRMVDNVSFKGSANGTTNFVYSADLSEATAASINQLRLAFATQRYLEALARSGSKYREVIKGIFGVNIGDTTAQMAEYLGGMTIELNIDQVLQTTNYVAGSSTKLGAPGASSTSAASDFLFTKSFQEPGYLVIVAYTKHERSYGQGIEEWYQKHEQLEDYNPKFANIGEQAIKSSNLYFTGEAADDDDRFGFQEAWSEYRHVRNKIIGALNPANSSSLNFWSLADNYSVKPTLGASFLKEDRDNITRVLSGGASSPDYFLDIKFKRTFVRPMPLYSIPGLIDHH